MAQAGDYALPQQTGVHLVQPGRVPMTGCCPQADEDEATLALINRMIGDINHGQYTSPQDERLRQCWHEDMLWWGPTGIGASYTIDRYIQQHQRPFRTQNEGPPVQHAYLPHG